MWKRCILGSRSVVAVSGSSAYKLLQSITSNDVQSLVSSGQIRSQYTNFLSSQGRIKCDAFIYLNPMDKRPLALLDCDSDHSEMLKMHLERYILRDDVHVTKMDNLYKVAAAWTDGSEECGIHVKDGNGTVVSPMVAPDPRIKKLGFRGLIPCELLDQLQLTATEDDYRRLRYSLGVAEGSEIETNKAMPLEWNMDYLNAIDFQKGCYMGQELTIRTKHTGVVRKRVIPVICGIKDKNRILIDVQSQRKAGVLIQADGSHGIALVRLEFLGANSTEFTANNERVLGYKPSWL